MPIKLDFEKRVRFPWKMGMEGIPGRGNSVDKGSEVGKQQECLEE